jgi:hypothetical protein
MAVNVLDGEGRQVPGLTAANFRGRAGGDKVDVVSVALDESPRRVAVLVDTSMSMQDRGNAAAFAWGAAEDLVRALAPGLRVFVVRLPREIHRASGPLPRSWTLEVVDADGRRNNRLELVYPRLLVPSSPRP